MSASDLNAYVNRLSFPPELEKQFHHDYFQKSYRSVRLGLWLGLALVAFFGVLDIWTAPLSLPTIWIIRFGLMCPFLALVLGLTHTPIFERFMLWMVSLAMGWVGLGLVVMMTIARPEEPITTSYYAGLILVILWGYTFSGLRFIHSAITSLVLLIGYEIAGLFLQHLLATQTGQVTLLIGTFFLISANVIGAFAAYTLELYTRRDFLQRQMIEQEKMRSEALLGQEAERTAQLTTLQVATQALTATLDLQTIFDVILAKLKEVVPYDSASIQQLTPEGLTIIGGSGFSQPAEILGLTFELVPGYNPNYEVVETRKPLILDEMGARGYRDYTRHVFAQTNIRSWMGVPLMFGDRVIGMLTLDKKQPNFYNDAQAQLAMGFGVQAAIAIENARLYSAARQELTERKRAESALRESEGRFRTIAQASPIPLVISRLSDDIILYANAPLAQLIGVAAPDLLDRRASDFYADVRERDRLVEAVRATGFTRDFEFRGKRADGSLFWAALTAQTTVLEGQAVMLVSLYEITQLKETQLQLQSAKAAAEAANVAKSAFLANMSHEIRTPMNAVMGMTELLRSTELNEYQYDLLDTIQASGEVLLTLINDILDFSKIEAGRLDLEQVPLGLETCLESVQSLLHPRAAEKGLTLRYAIAPGVPTAIASDIVRLRQILINLVGNAIKFTEHGEVVVTVKRAEVDEAAPPVSETAPASWIKLHFAVRDTGIGVPPDKAEPLFQPFTQLDASTTRQYGGTGLGLAICRRLVELMGGTIWVESAGVAGQGSTFHFTIRAETVPSWEEAPVNLPPPTTIPGLSPLRILLAEDVAVNRKYALLALKSIGQTADVALNGREAVEAVERQAYDVVLMDMQMPIMDGLEAARQIRALKAHQPYIIALTANALPRDRDLCLDAGMNDFASKPISVSDLQAALQRATQFSSVGVTAELRQPAQVVVKEGAAIDRETLAELLQATNDLSLIDLFVNDTDKVLADLRAALERFDSAAIQHKAHDLKSSTAALGAQRLSDLSARLDSAARANTLDEAASLLSDIEAEYQQVREELALFRQTLA